MFFPAESNASIEERIAATSPVRTASARPSRAERETSPKTPRALSSVMSPPENETSWSSEESASRIPPSAPRAIARSASSVAEMPSFPQMYFRREKMSFVWMRRRSKRWQRETMVASTLSPSVVANTKRTCGGGSSRVFSSAFHAALESMWHSSMMKILNLDDVGLNCTASTIGLTSSTLLCEAASSSVTSSDRPPAISWQFTHCPHGSTPFGDVQLRAFANILERVVLPMPRGPMKRYALAIRPDSIAWRSVRTTCSCPTTSSNVIGRYFSGNDT